MLANKLASLSNKAWFARYRVSRLTGAYGPNAYTRIQRLLEIGKAVIIDTSTDLFRDRRVHIPAPKDLVRVTTVSKDRVLLSSLRLRLLRRGFCSLLVCALQRSREVGLREGQRNITKQKRNRGDFNKACSR